MAKLILYGVLILVLLIGIPYGIYKFKRWWNYSVGGYSTAVEGTVCEMVRPEYLKNPERCD